MGKPKITIILAAYNMEKYIEETLASIYAQTSDDWKLIVIDDGSTDSTREIIARCTEGKPRTLIMHGTHKGLGPIRNEAIEQADTEWILPFDADDLMHPDLIEEFNNAIDENPDGDLFVCWYHHFEGEDRIVERRWLGYEKLLRKNHIPSESCYRKASWARAGKYRPRFRWEDWEMWIRMLNPNSKVIEIPKVLIEYRIRPDSVSHAMDKGEKFHERMMIRAANRDIFRKYKA